MKHIRDLSTVNIPEKFTIYAGSFKIGETANKSMGLCPNAINVFYNSYPNTIITQSHNFLNFIVTYFVKSNSRCRTRLQNVTLTNQWIVDHMKKIIKLTCSFALRPYQPFFCIPKPLPPFKGDTRRGKVNECLGYAGKL